MKPVLDELDQDVRSLLDEAASRIDAPEDAKRRILTRLSQTLGASSPVAPVAPRTPVHAPPASAAGAAGHAASRIVATAFIAGALTGAGAVALLRRPAPERIVYVDRPAAPARSAAPSSSQSGVPALNATAPASIPSSAETNASPQRAAAPAPSRGGPKRGDGLDAERSLLDVARRALAEGKPADALPPLVAHARRFPTGVLVEEREALAINALVGSRRYDDARARAAEFLKRFPGSLLRSSVEAAVAAIP